MGRRRAFLGGLFWRSWQAPPRRFTHAAQPAFPSKGLRIVVPFAAGGVGDLTARIVAAKLGERLGAARGDREPPGVLAGWWRPRAWPAPNPTDHSLFLMSNGTAVTANLFKALPFDTARDFAPISTLGFFDIAVVSHPDAPFKTFAELLDVCQGEPREAQHRQHQHRQHPASGGRAVQEQRRHRCADHSFQWHAQPHRSAARPSGGRGRGNSGARAHAGSGRCAQGAWLWPASAVHRCCPTCRPPWRRGVSRLPGVLVERPGGASENAASRHRPAGNARSPPRVADAGRSEESCANSTSIRARPHPSRPRRCWVNDIQRWGRVIERAGIPRQ